MTIKNHGDEPLPVTVRHVSEIMRLVLQQHGLRLEERADLGEPPNAWVDAHGGKFRIVGDRLRLSLALERGGGSAFNYQRFRLAAAFWSRSRIKSPAAVFAIGAMQTLLDSSPRIECA